MKVNLFANVFVFTSNLLEAVFGLYLSVLQMNFL